MKNYNTPELTVIELTPEEIIAERDTIVLAKMTHSKKRRQDKKFKAKDLKKFLRETNHLPSFEKAEVFFKNRRRHPNAHKASLSIKIVNEDINDLIEEANDILYDEGALLYEDEPWYVYNPETRSWDFDDNEFEFQQMLSDEYGEEDARIEEEKQAEWALYMNK